MHHFQSRQFIAPPPARDPPQITEENAANKGAKPKQLSSTLQPFLPPPCPYNLKVDTRSARKAKQDDVYPFVALEQHKNCQDSHQQQKEENM